MREYHYNQLAFVGWMLLAYHVETDLGIWAGITCASIAVSHGVFGVYELIRGRSTWN